MTALGLCVNVDHLVEREDFEHRAHRVGRRDDDQPPTQPDDPFVHVE